MRLMHDVEVVADHCIAPYGLQPRSIQVLLCPDRRSAPIFFAGASSTTIAISDARWELGWLAASAVLEAARNLQTLASRAWNLYI